MFGEILGWYFCKVWKKGEGKLKNLKEIINYVEWFEWSSKDIWKKFYEKIEVNLRKIGKNMVKRWRKCKKKLREIRMTFKYVVSIY